MAVLRIEDPKSCNLCPLCVDGDHCIITGCYFKDEIEEFDPKLTTMSDCPLIMEQASGEGKNDALFTLFMADVLTQEEYARFLARIDFREKET